MTAELEFFLVAVAIYLWECCLWVPLRGPLLRRAMFRHAWSAVDPSSLLVLRDRGLVIGFPMFADTGLAVCQSPPLVAGPDGALWLDDGNGKWQAAGKAKPGDIRIQSPRLHVGDASVPVISPLAARRLAAAASNGMSAADAARADW